MGAQPMKRAIPTFFLVVCFFLVLCFAAVSWGADGKTAAVPVLAGRSPVDCAQRARGLQDHDGWKDPYSSSQATKRQTDYARAFRITSPYTPQVVIRPAPPKRWYCSHFW